VPSPLTGRQRLRSWLADERGDLSPQLDGALRAMADAFQV